MTFYDVIAKTHSFLLRGGTTDQARRRLFAQLESLTDVGSLDAAFSEIKGILRDYDAARAAPMKDSKLSRILEYIGTHVTDPDFSAAHVAEEFDMERANFSRYFKRHTGSTFVEHVSSLRIERARRLLASTDMPLNEIVRRIGYSDPSAFIRKFRKYIGVTPAAYRENWRNVTA
jgi:AraC-like DNA-binding protein